MSVDRPSKTPAHVIFLVYWRHEHGKLDWNLHVSILLRTRHWPPAYTRSHRSRNSLRSLLTLLQWILLHDLFAVLQETGLRHGTTFVRNSTFASKSMETSFDKINECRARYTQAKPDKNWILARGHGEVPAVGWDFSTPFCQNNARVLVLRLQGCF